jgi:hypothetical protein
MSITRQLPRAFRNGQQPQAIVSNFPLAATGDLTDQVLGAVFVR